MSLYDLSKDRECQFQKDGDKLGRHFDIEHTTKKVNGYLYGIQVRNNDDRRLNTTSNPRLCKSDSCVRDSLYSHSHASKSI